ncbi:MAG: J domain-containing protein [Telmatospirillum sp.]|nr:J domain-containing protein [Telmatospirillum sp.]
MNGQSRKFWPPKGKQSNSGGGRPCDHPGCDRSGDYRAPKSPQTLQDYYWFCLDHVREYNASWDYYAGLKPDEIERILRMDTTWQRPTWPLGTLSGGRFRFDPEKVRDPFDVFGPEMHRPQHPPEAAQPVAEQTAMRVMNLSLPLTLEKLKARYKELCKLHHPDANGGDKAAEERFKQIGQAYKTLRESLNLS